MHLVLTGTPSGRKRPSACAGMTKQSRSSVASESGSVRRWRSCTDVVVAVGRSHLSSDTDGSRVTSGCGGSVSGPVPPPSTGPHRSEKCAIVLLDITVIVRVAENYWQMINIFTIGLQRTGLLMDDVLLYKKSLISCCK